MQTMQQSSITLPGDIANLVKAKVQAGEYASESEFICDGLRVLMAHDRIMENWLRKQVSSAYDALKANPSRAVTAEGVHARLAAEHANVDVYYGGQHYEMILQDDNGPTDVGPSRGDDGFLVP